MLLNKVPCKMHSNQVPEVIPQEQNQHFHEVNFLSSLRPFWLSQSRGSRGGRAGRGTRPRPTSSRGRASPSPTSPRSRRTTGPCWTPGGSCTSGLRWPAGLVHTRQFSQHTKVFMAHKCSVRTYSNFRRRQRRI